MTDMTMIWNAILTMAIGGFMWWIRSTSLSISKIKDDMTQLMQRFDRLEGKIDDMIRRSIGK